MPVNSVFAYYQGLRILANGLSIVGNGLVESKAKPGEKCVAAPLHVNLAYADNALKCTSDQNASVEWMRTRDEATRARAIELQREGWPQGEALQSAWQSQEIYWIVAPPPPPHPAKRPLENPDAPSPVKGAKPRTANMVGSKFICKKHNGNRGCTPKESACPDSRLHCCDIVKPDNQVCAAKDHTRLQCPFR